MILPRRRPDAAEVARHYGDLDRYYRELWGEHLHHGLWEAGEESPDEAVLTLLRLVAERAGIGEGDRVCDVGSGYGATARWLARERGARVTAVTVSPAQHAWAVARSGLRGRDTAPLAAPPQGRRDRTPGDTASQSRGGKAALAATTEARGHGAPVAATTEACGHGAPVAATPQGRGGNAPAAAGTQDQDGSVPAAATTRGLLRDPAGPTPQAAGAGGGEGRPGVRYVLSDWLANDEPAAAYDVVLAVECLAHLADLQRALVEMARVLRPGGRLVACVWLAREGARPWEVRHLLRPICEEGRLSRLLTADELGERIADAGLEPGEVEDLSRRVARTWTVCLARAARRIVTDPETRRFLRDASQPERVFALTLLRMRLAFATGSLRYGVVRAVKRG